VTCVDISQSAIDMAKANAVRNGLDGKMDFVCEDVLICSQNWQNKNAMTMIISFLTAGFYQIPQDGAVCRRGYKEINLKAMKLLPRGGYLATCSCSHFMTDDLFRKTLASAAKDASVSLRQIEARQQAPDHPSYGMFRRRTI